MQDKINCGQEAMPKKINCERKNQHKMKSVADGQLKMNSIANGRQQEIKSIVAGEVNIR